MELNGETLRFIREHCKDDVRSLALQAPKYPGVDMPVALTQIAGRQAAAEKIPSWHEEEGVLYPRHLSLEQCSSEATARYKASIIPGSSSGTLTDLTGGFGIDCAFLSPEIPSCHLCGTAGSSLRDCIAQLPVTGSESHPDRKQRRHPASARDVFRRLDIH